MDVIGAAFGGFLLVPSELLGDVPKLAHQVKPLADAHVVQEFLLHALAEGIAAHLGAGVLEEIPQVEHGEEVGGGVLKARVGLVGLRLVFEGALANVLDGHGCDDDHDVFQAAGAVGLDEHARHAGVDGDAGKVAADVGENRKAVFFLLRVQGAELAEEQQAIANGLVLRRLHEGELRDIA